MATESVVITAHFGSSAQVKMSKCQKYHFCMSPKMTVKRIATDARLKIDSDGVEDENISAPTGQH